MGHPWYETTLLVVSNFPIIFALMSTGLRKKPKLEDFVVFLTVGICSPVYHLCQSGDICLGESMFRLRPMDHIFVWVLGTWVALRIMRPDKRILVSTLIFFFMTFVMLADYLVATMLFPAVFVVYFVFMYAIKEAGLHMPLIQFGALLFAWAVLMLSSGLYFFYLSSDTEEANYWIWHSVWHVLAETAIWLIYEAGTGTSLLRLIHGQRAQDLFMHWANDVSQWNDQFFHKRYPHWIYHDV